MLTAHQLAPQHIPRAGSRRRRSIPHFRGTVHVAAPDPMSMILYVCYCVCLDEVCFLRYPSTVTMGRTDVVCCTVAFLNGATAHAPTHGPATPTRAGQSAVGRGAVRCGPFPCGSSLEWRRSRSRDRGRSPRSRTGRGRRARGTSRAIVFRFVRDVLGKSWKSSKQRTSRAHPHPRGRGRRVSGAAHGAAVRTAPAAGAPLTA